MTNPASQAGRKAVAGIPVASHAAPPTTGPTKEHVYAIVNMAADSRATFSGAESRGGNASAHTKTNPETTPRIAVQASSQASAASATAGTPTAIVAPLTMKGQRRPMKRDGANVMTIEVGN